jgi:hypothetical protein
MEDLEDRMLLYSATGGSWTHPDRITYSIVPDGTSIGGTSSALYSTFNSQSPSWHAAIQQAAAVWEQVANINLVEVSDNGAALGAGSYQQGDPNNGDIRISAIPLAPGTLASAFLPPAFNGGPDAGDIIFNSSQNWSSSGYDVQTVAIHELGHALGMGHSAITAADMYSSYTAVKQSLNSDDVSGIQSIYSTRQPDAWTATYSNTTKANAADITSQLGSNGQATLTNLDIVGSSTANWFKVTVPSSTTGNFTVTMQSTNLSELSPRVQVYNAAGTSLGYSTAPNTYGSTVSLTLTGVTAGTTYYVKAMAANSGATGAGDYGLQLNFGSGSMSAITPPSTQVANQADVGGGSLNELALDPTTGLDLIAIGSVTGAGDNMTIASAKIRHKSEAEAHGNGLDDGNELARWLVLASGDNDNVPTIQVTKSQPRGPRS